MAEKLPRTSANTNNTTGLVGVCFHKKNNKWVASIRLGYHRVHLGTFGSAMEAGHAYNKAAIVIHGPKALLNPVDGVFLLPDKKDWKRPYRLDVPLGLDPCTEWEGARNIRTGYGMCMWESDVHGSHRVAYVNANGLKLSDIKGKVVRHICDNRICVNPKHLGIGTYAENNRDTISRGRNRAKGDKWKPE